MTHPRNALLSLTTSDVSKKSFSSVIHKSHVLWRIVYKEEQSSFFYNSSLICSVIYFCLNCMENNVLGVYCDVQAESCGYVSHCHYRNSWSLAPNYEWMKIQLPQVLNWGHPNKSSLMIYLIIQYYSKYLQKLLNELYCLIFPH